MVLLHISGRRQHGPTFPGPLSMGFRKLIVEMSKKKKKLCSNNNICVRGLTAFKGAQEGRTNHQLRSSRDTPRYFQCKFRQESLVSIFIYGFNLGLISYLDFREMSPLPRGYMCKQQKFRIRGTKGLNRVLGVQIRGRRKEENLFSPKPGASLGRSDHWRERKNSV